jgi:hypothetical protein
LDNFALTPVIASSYEGYLDKTGKKLIPFNTNVINRLDMEREDYGFGSSITNYGNWAKGRLTSLTEWQAYYRALAAGVRPRQSLELHLCFCPVHGEI